MPSKKRKYNERFPAGRIKKIMQTDEEVGKVAQAVPVIISRTLELFVESLLTKAMEITNARNAKTLSPSHMKQCILSESRFDFLKDLVKNIPDVNNDDNPESFSLANTQPTNLEKKHTTVPTLNHGAAEHSSAQCNYSANFYTEQTSSGITAGAPSVIQYQSKATPSSPEVSNDVAVDLSGPPKFHLGPKPSNTRPIDVPQLIPIIQQPSRHDVYSYGSSAESLCIDEDYDI